MKTHLNMALSFSFAMLALAPALAADAPQSGGAYCDQTCSQLVSTNGQIKGIVGSGPWSSADDAWCDQNGLGSQTPVAQASSTPATSASPVAQGASAPTSPAINCVALRQQVAVNPTLSLPPECASVSASNTTGALGGPTINSQTALQCYYRHSQVLTHCLAYQAAHGAGGSESLILTMDVAATATCATACVMQAAQGPGAAAVMACKYVSMSVAAAELIQTLTNKNQGAGKMIGAIAAGAAGFNSSKASVGIPAASAAPPASTEDALAPRADSSVTVTPASTTTQNKSVTKSGNPCLSAAIFAYLTGLRQSNIKAQNAVKGKECQSIGDLAGNFNTSLLPPAKVPTTQPSTMPSQSAPAIALDCVQNRTLAECSHSNAADTNLLSQSGLDHAALPKAHDILSSLSGSGGGGSASDQIGKALGGGGAGGSLSDNLQSLAQAGEAAKPETYTADAGEMKSAGGGGSGGAGKSPGQGDFGVEVFGSLLNGGGDRGLASAGGGGAQDRMHFRTMSLDPNDIWHEKSGLSLFDIVSQRIEKVKVRNDQMSDDALDAKARLRRSANVIR